jgi:lysophospholipase L1-like esterase
MIFDKNDKLVMIGDSITDCGRKKPAGEGLFDPYGNGYVNMVKAFLDASYPEKPIRIINQGFSGYTVRALKESWDEIALRHKPNWLSIMIGINDVWRHFDSAKITEDLVSIEEYESTLDDLIKQSLPNLKGLILMTPYYIDANPDDPMRIMMDAYGERMKGLAKKHKAILVDTQIGFDNMLKHMHPMGLAWDRIHPNTSGHAQLAKCFLEAVDFKL